METEQFLHQSDSDDLSTRRSVRGVGSDVDGRAVGVEAIVAAGRLTAERLLPGSWVGATLLGAVAAGILSGAVSRSVDGVFFDGGVAAVVGTLGCVAVPVGIALVAGVGPATAAGRLLLGWMVAGAAAVTTSPVGAVAAGVVSRLPRSG